MKKTIYILLLALVVEIYSQCNLDHWSSYYTDRNTRISQIKSKNSFRIDQTKTTTPRNDYNIDNLFSKIGTKTNGKIQCSILKMDINSYTKDQTEQFAGLSVVQVLNSQYVYMGCVINFEGKSIMRTHNNTIFVTEFGTSFYDSSFWIQMEWLNEKIRCGFSKDKKNWVFSSFESVPLRTELEFSYGILYKNQRIGTVGSAIFSDIEIQNVECKNGGICKRINSTSACVCENNYIGQFCDEFSCFGLKPNDTNVCSGNGVCISHNTCKCNSNTTLNGPQCEKVEGFQPRECEKKFDFSIPFASGQNSVILNDFKI
jgi:hypothetical protein